MIEKNSATWEHITSRIKEELASLDALNRTDIDSDRTTRCRARIRAFEDVLTWADAAPDTPDEGIQILQ